MVIHGKIRQTIAHVFMLPHELNTSLLDYNLFLFYLIAITMDDFNFIMAIINAGNIISVQIDHCCVFLIVIIYELLIMPVDTLELFFMVLYNNFSINGDKNWLLYTLFHEQWITKTISLIMIIIICEFYVIVCIVIYLHVQINSTITFKCPSNDTTNTVKSGSNDGHTTVQRECNVGELRVKSEKYHTQQTNILKIILCINVITVHRHNDNMFNKISYTWTDWIMILKHFYLDLLIHLQGYFILRVLPNIYSQHNLKREVNEAILQDILLQLLILFLIQILFHNFFEIAIPACKKNYKKSKAHVDIEQKAIAINEAAASATRGGGHGKRANIALVACCAESVDTVSLDTLHITAPHENASIDIEYSFFIFICSY